MSIYKKLLDIQKSVRGMAKDKSSYSYQYVSGSKILSHIRYKMDELGVLLKQEILDIENVRQEYVVTGTKYVENQKIEFERNKVEILSKVSMRFTWIDVDTGERDENLFGANGQNDFEKGLGSALTYAERYFLLKYFHIPTDEDDIDNPDRKPTDEDDKGKATTTAPKDDDGLPWLNEKQFNAILARINKGEKLVSETAKTFRMKKTYKETLRSAEQNYKPTT